jgi:hypothetical protein
MLPRYKFSAKGFHGECYACILVVLTLGIMRCNDMNKILSFVGNSDGDVFVVLVIWETCDFSAPTCSCRKEGENQYEL